MSTTELDGKTAIVTGAGGQIGGGIARELAKAGCNVVLADVDVLDTAYNQQSSEEMHGAETAHKLADDIETMGRRTLVVECDVTKADQVEAMIDQTVEEFGGVDIMVNNAGILTLSTVEELEESEWDAVMDVNAKGVFLCAKAAIPELKRSKGTMINTASIAGEIGLVGLGHYVASKHAVMGLTKCLALELASDDVTVNAICPGIVNTPMWSKVLAPSMEGSYEEIISELIPLGRDQTPEDMGKLAVFFATNRNVTGEAVKIDGGISQAVI